VTICCPTFGRNRAQQPAKTSDKRLAAGLPRRPRRKRCARRADECSNLPKHPARPLRELPMCSPGAPITAPPAVYPRCTGPSETLSVSASFNLCFNISPSTRARPAQRRLSALPSQPVTTSQAWALSQSTACPSLQCGIATGQCPPRGPFDIYAALHFPVAKFSSAA
jgi:hypothetical protein